MVLIGGCAATGSLAACGLVPAACRGRQVPVDKYSCSMAIHKTTGPQPVNAGEEIHYSLEVVNEGPSDANIQRLRRGQIETFVVAPASSTTLQPR